MNGAIVGVAIVIVVVMLAVVLKMGKGVSGQKREEIHRDLDAVRSLSQSDISSQKLAVIRGDTLLGKAMQYAGIKGQTVGEGLKNARKRFPRDEYEDLWRVHKLRNTLVHERYDISNRETEWAISVYTSAIRRLIK